MTFLMLIGTICFCVFVILCTESMLAYSLEGKKKRFILTLVIMLCLAIVIRVFNIQELHEYMSFIIPIAVGVIGQWIIYVSIKKAIFSSILGFHAIFSANGILMMGIRLLDSSIEVGTTQWAIANISIFCGMILISLLLKRFLTKRIDMNIFNHKFMHFLIFISIVVVFLIYVNSAVEEPIQIGLGTWYIDLSDVAHLLVLVASVIMFAIIIKYISRETSLKTEMLINEASKQYIHDLEESYRALRTIKHDYVNIMTSFKLYIDNNNMEGLEKYYYKELSEMNKALLHQDQLMGSLQNIEINEIKSILVYKGSVAVGHQIATNIEARETIVSLGVSTAIVCQILGILLDNAIEATLEVSKKAIDVALIKNPNSKTFIVRNTWQNKGASIIKLFELGYSTKAEGRGVGLYTVRDYTNKIKGIFLETEFTDEYFTQILTVKDEY